MLDTQKQYLDSLSRTLLLFCSKKRLVAIITDYEKSNFSAAKSTPKRSPRQILSTLRQEVDFYKSSTIQIVWRSCGLAAILGILVYYFYFYYYGSRWGISSMAAVCGSAILSIFLWQCINGSALLYLYRFDSLKSKRLIGLGVVHLLWFLLVLGIYCIMSQETYLSGTLFAHMGIPPNQVGEVQNAVFLFLGTVAFILLVASVACTVWKSVWYFTLSCHCLLLLCMIFLVRRYFSSMSAIPSDYNADLSRGLILYGVGILLYVAVPLFYGKKLKNSGLT